MVENRVILIISVVFILGLIIGGTLGYLIIGEKENEDEDEMKSPLAQIHFNVNERKGEEIPRTFLSEKLDNFYFVIEDTVTFYGDDSMDPDGLISEYLWFFSDNLETMDGRIIDRVFHRTGKHWANLTVVDNDGLINTTTISFEVKQKPNLGTTQDGNWLRINFLDWIGGPVNSTQVLQPHQIKLWIDEDYNRYDNYRIDDDGFEDYWGWDDSNGDELISGGEKIYIYGLIHLNISSVVVSIYYYPYDVDHLGSPTFLDYEKVRTESMTLGG